MAMLLAVVIIAFIIILIWWTFNYYKYYRHLKRYATSYIIPLIGHAHNARSTLDIIPLLEYVRITVGDIAWITLGPRQILIISDAKLAEFVLSSTQLIEKAVDYRLLHPWLGFGLLTSSGDRWRKHRKMLTPAFHFQILEQFIEVFNSASEILVDKLQKEVDKDAVDICPYVKLCTLDIICESAMGTSLNAQHYPDSDYVKSVHEMCRIMIVRTVNPFKNIDFFYRFTKDCKKEKRALEVLHGHTNSVIKSRRQELLKQGNFTNTDELGKKKRLAFLDLLLHSSVDGRPLTDLEIREEVDTFMFEGHDTTASAIGFVLLCLANNKNIQENAVNELKSIFNDDFARPATYTDLNEMKYLEMIIKETLRLYPSVPFYARHLHEDVQFDDVLLPKGLTLLVYPYGLGRNPKVFPDSQKFDPERFSLENCTERHPYSYLPFSAGPRNCIGQKFAMLEVKSTVSKLLRNFRLSSTEPNYEPMLVAETILKAAVGIYIKFEKREF